MPAPVIIAATSPETPPEVRSPRQPAILAFLSGDGRSAESYDDSWAATPPAEVSPPKFERA